LAHTYTHGSEGAAATGLLQLVNGGEDETSAAHAQRMTEGNGSAIGIDVGRIISDGELSQARQ